MLCNILKQLKPSLFQLFKECVELNAKTVIYKEINLIRKNTEYVGNKVNVRIIAFFKMEL